MQKIKIAMIGGGISSLIGSAHRDGIQLSGQYDLVAACFSSTLEKSAQLCTQLDISPRLYDNWTQMLETEAQKEDGARAVVVVTPDHLHYENCHKALSLGFHVICDKPLCQDYTQAEELFLLAKKQGKRLETTYTVTGDPAYRAFRNYVTALPSSEILQITGTCIVGWARDFPEFDPKHPMHKYAWRFIDGQGSGALGDIMVHIFEYCDGLVNTSPIALTGCTQKISPRRELNDGGQALLQYPDGLLMSLRYSLALTQDSGYAITVNTPSLGIYFRMWDDVFTCTHKDGTTEVIQAFDPKILETYRPYCENSQALSIKDLRSRLCFKNLYDQFAENILQNHPYQDADYYQHLGLKGMRLVAKLQEAEEKQTWLRWI